jgi:hypothetical protein
VRQRARRKESPAATGLSSEPRVLTQRFSFVYSIPPVGDPQQSYDEQAALLHEYDWREGLYEMDEAMGVKRG